MVSAPEDVVVVITVVIGVVLGGVVVDELRMNCGVGGGCIILNSSALVQHAMHGVRWTCTRP